MTESSDDGTCMADLHYVTPLYTHSEWSGSYRNKHSYEIAMHSSQTIGIRKYRLVPKNAAQQLGVCSLLFNWQYDFRHVPKTAPFSLVRGKATEQVFSWLPKQGKQ